GQLYFERAAGKPVSHFIFVGEGPLRHQVGMLPELEPAGDMGGLAVGRDFGYCPEVGVLQEAMKRDGSFDVAESHVECVVFAVRPEAVVAQPVGPWREEGYAAQLGFFLEFGKVGCWEVENVLAVYFHFADAIPDGGENRDFDAACGIGETDDGDTVIGGCAG